MKILIADDDIKCRRNLYQFLKNYGECDLVVDGMEALDAFLLSTRENDPYDLICLDIAMPILDGTKVLEFIRDFENQENILPDKRSKVIMTTELAEVPCVQNAFCCGCDAYAAKPLNTKKFVDVLGQLGFDVCNEY